MEKMKMETKDLTQENIKKIGELFPNIITEARDPETKRIKNAIDFDALRQILSDVVISEGSERYNFTWPGKKEAILEANRPIRKTLRPCIEESKNWETTENIYIEGDNLDALKLLQESYLESVKMIYIDPPYNTGKDSFLYSDKFLMDIENYKKESGIRDNEDNILFKENNMSNPRFHSDWCSMITSRLYLSRNLLSRDGAIFISIDDGEVTNLVKICDEVFGERNRVAIVCHKSRASISNDKIISQNHNFILFYAKDIDVLHNNRKKIGLDPVLKGFDYDDNDGRGLYRLVPVDGPGGAKKGNPYYEFLGVEGYFRFSKETMAEKYREGFVVKKGSSLYQKYYRSTAENTRRTDNTWWNDGGLSSTATSKLKKLMGASTFDTPKPVELIQRMIKLITGLDKDAIIMDFFAGSSTTAHAVFLENALDEGNRKFILVQMPETINEKSDATDEGYSTISEIGMERIRRAGEEVQIEDTGFRVFKIDDTNMKDVYYSSQGYRQSMIDGLVDNIKEDRNELDLLYGIIIDWGLKLSVPIKKIIVDSKIAYSIDSDAMIAYFEPKVSEQAIKEISNMKPTFAVFRDSSFFNVQDKINLEEAFKNESPDTMIKVI